MSIEERFPAQFEGGEYFLGISVDEGWEPIVIEACQAIEDTLSADDLARFHWIQIKQKFATLQMYWGPSNSTPVSIQSPDGVALFEVASTPASEANCLPVETVERIRQIIHNAQRRAARTCEQCGQPGRLYQDGYWAVECDTHAMARHRLFPHAYGELIETPQRSAEFDGRPALRSAQLYFRNTVLPVWHWQDDPAPFTWHDELPAELLAQWPDTARHQFVVGGNATPTRTAVGLQFFLDWLHTASQGEGELARQLQAHLALPQGAMVPGKSPLEVALAVELGGDVEVEKIFNGFKHPALAVVRDPNQQRQVIKIETRKAFSYLEARRLQAKLEQASAELQQLMVLYEL